jgi:uncharacterized protein
MKRIYDTIIADHFKGNDQMLFFAGPRQVGKTTSSRTYLNGCEFSKYLNWDNFDSQNQILSGPKAVLEGIPIEAALSQKPRLVFDEIHKFKGWKNFLKGIYDEYKSRLDILVTGSSKLAIFSKGGDSLMGRYFLHRIHPLTVGELISSDLPQGLAREPQKLPDRDFETLYEFGGFPEPFLKADKRFFNRWQKLRRQQLMREDIRELASIQEVSLLEVLGDFLKAQSGQLLNYSNLANKIRVSDPTIKRWIQVLESFYYCFTIQPWSQNVTRSLLKEPKVYLWDWSVIADKGQRVENFVASHLLKSVHFWTDRGEGEFELYFLRDKDKREVDFLITRDGAPWLMLEVKSSYKEHLNPSLTLFQDQIQAKHVLQLAFDLPYTDINCFELDKPTIVSASGFLSQLI